MQLTFRALFPLGQQPLSPVSLVKPLLGIRPQMLQVQLCLTRVRMEERSLHLQNAPESLDEEP